jgi:hypothetical protein
VTRAGRFLTRIWRTTGRARAAPNKSPNNSS